MRPVNPAREQARLDFSRPVMIHVCKDGTISYRTKAEPVFNGVAMPVFSVDTIEQALDAQVMFGRKQYVDHPQLPGRPWYKWTGFPGTVEALDKVTDRLREWFYKYYRKPLTFEQARAVVATVKAEARAERKSHATSGREHPARLNTSLGVVVCAATKVDERWAYSLTLASEPIQQSELVRRLMNARQL